MRLIYPLLLVLAFMLTPSVSQAQSNEKFAAGIHLGNLSTGFSFKYRATDTITAQATAGFFGTLNYYSVRGLYAFNTGPFYEIYGYGAAGLWRWSGFLVDESSFGFGAGAGVEYDLRGIAPELPPLFASFELGFNFVNFDTYTGFSSFGQGIALHYRF